MSDFYVGYDPNPPAGLMRFVGRVVLGMIAFGALVALVLVLAQQPFAAAFFDFGHEQVFNGTIEEHPFPTLAVRIDAPDGVVQGVHEWEHYTLVARGKHGAESMVQGWDGRRAKVRGTFIHRGDQWMIELAAPPEAAEPVAAELATGGGFNQPLTAG